MRWMKWVGVFAALQLIVACFLPWVHIEFRSIIITGVDSGGTNWGMPGNAHFLFAGIYLILGLIPKIWAKRTNIFIGGINLAWAVRNFIMIAGCEAGECPVKKIGLYLILFSSILMLIAALFPDIKLEDQNK